MIDALIIAFLLLILSIIIFIWCSYQILWKNRPVVGLAGSFVVSIFILILMFVQNYQCTNEYS